MAHAARCETTKSFTPNILTKPPFIVYVYSTKVYIAICTCVVQVNINRRTRRVKTHTQPILSDPLGMGWGWRRRRRRRQSRRQVRSSFKSHILQNVLIYTERDMVPHVFYKPTDPQGRRRRCKNNKERIPRRVCVCVRCVYTAWCDKTVGNFLLLAGVVDFLFA